VQTSRILAKNQLLALFSTGTEKGSLRCFSGIGSNVLKRKRA
jgi:hypothetical protein